MTSVPCSIPRSLCLKYKSKFYPISSHQNPYTPANSQLILTTLSNNVESYQKYVMAR